MNISEFKIKLNQWGEKKIPFLFWIDFELEKPVVIQLNEVNNKEVLYSINGSTNAKLHHTKTNVTKLIKNPVPFSQYLNKFNKVAYHLNYGDTFLANLTSKTEIGFKGSLEEIFYSSKAKYKLFVRDQFLVFSPEIFIKIQNGKIFSYPMKGTIDSSLPDAPSLLLNNEKEKAEHVTIVDLIRNDLSMVASQVHVSNFRYLEELQTNEKNLLQVSSEIVGTLDKNYYSQLGDILVALLPAGSICGAPKKKTVEILTQAEQERRGYYTGVLGLFDGVNLDAGVMIRFIEQVKDKYYFRSGGGITTQSDPEIEYQEMIDKVYVPIN